MGTGHGHLIERKQLWLQRYKVAAVVVQLRNEPHLGSMQLDTLRRSIPLYALTESLSTA